MHSAETPINSPRKPPGSILIACLMRKVRHALWQTLGKLYRLLMSRFHSLPSQLSAARSLVLLLRKRWRGEEATQVWAGLDHHLLHHVQKMSVQEPRFNLGSADQVTAPRDAGTAVFCTGNSMDGSISFRWRKKQNGCKWVIKGWVEERRKIICISLLRSSMRKGTYVLNK